MKKLVLIISLAAAIAGQANAQDNVVRTPKGAEVKIFTKNPGDKIKLSDVITFHVVQKSPKDSVLFSSYTLGHPLKIQVQQAQNVGDLMDVLVLLTAKDSAYVKIPSDSVFKGHEEQRPVFLPKGSTLSFTVKIEQVQSLADAMAEVQTAEVNASNKYIADHKLAVTTTASGLKYIITQPSAKLKPAKGDTALVNYTGRTLDGKVFDSSIKAEADKAGLQEPGRKFEPLVVVIGTTPIIKGWDEGLQLLNEGSKAQFIIPSALGYGAEGAGSDIGPYSTLLFDIELVKVKPAKHTAAAPAHPVTQAPAKKSPAKKKS